MKLEYNLLQLKLFQMRPITIFYGKPFFRFKKKTHRTLQWMSMYYQSSWSNSELTMKTAFFQTPLGRQNLVDDFSTRFRQSLENETR